VVTTHLADVLRQACGDSRHRSVALGEYVPKARRRSWWKQKETTVNAAPVAVENPRPWWLTLISGILAFIVGAILLWAPTNARIDTWQLLISLLGIYWLVVGVLDLVHMFTDHTNWGWKLFSGIFSILPSVFALILGLWGVIYGIVALVMGIKGAGWAAVILGALAIFFGAVLVANWSVPGMGLSFVLVAAIGGLVGGVVLIVHAFQQKGSTPTTMAA
jgi:uncharacterized membrane protein HdeD (DUF308 family)